MRVLLTEDDPISATVFGETLRRAGYEVDLAQTGDEAVERLATRTYDIHVLDWMLPGTDGIEVARRARLALDRPPLVVMVTALAFPEARTHALRSGADEFLAKPFRPRELTDAIARGLARLRQQAPAGSAAGSASPAPVRAAFPCVAIAASTGGPEALRTLVASRALPASAAYVVVLHGPAWLHESVADALGAASPLPVSLARAGEMLRPGRVVLAGGDRHLSVSPGLALETGDGPPENLVRPAADPLFRSVAAAFGSAAIGVVLSGVGADGALGSAAILERGGRVLVQDPSSCMAPGMPRASLLLCGSRAHVHPLDDLGAEVAHHVAATAAAPGEGAS